MLKYIRLVSLCLMAGPFCKGTLGNNNLFLPGDAFFPTVLTADDLARLTADAASPPTFEYSSFGGYRSAFCGYAGFNRAKVEDLDDAFVANLKKAYSRIREAEDRELVEQKRNGEIMLIETNGARVLFYAESFAFPNFRIGLRYNENWVEEVTKFGHNRRAIRLCCLVNDPKAVEESWRDSVLVAPLPATLPAVKRKPVPVTDTPILIRGPVKAIVLNSAPLDAYFSPENLTTVLVVDSSGIVELLYEEGKWRSKSE